jgi:hypothetical protein
MAGDEKVPKVVTRAEPASASVTPINTNHTSLLSLNNHARAQYFLGQGGVASGAGYACSACHPPMTNKQREQWNRNRVTELVRQTALALLAAHRSHIESLRVRFLSDKQGETSLALAAAWFVIEIEKLDSRLSADQMALWALAAEARRSWSFDPDWIDEFLSHTDKTLDLKANLDGKGLPSLGSGNFAGIVDGVVGLRHRQRKELAQNLEVIYRRFPFMGTLPPANLLAPFHHQEEAERLAKPEHGVSKTRAESPDAGMSKFTTGDAGLLTGSEKNLPVPPLPGSELEKTPEQIERAYRILLINVDDVVKKVRSNDIDPLSLPEAVAIAAERMDGPDKQVLNELQTEREANGILASIGIAALSGASLGATGVAAFVLGGADIVIGGTFFAQEADEYFDRKALEQASASHDRSLLGVPPTSGTEAIMLIVNGLVTAAGLVNLAGALRGFGKSPKGTGSGSGPVSSRSMAGTSGGKSSHPGPTEPMRAATTIVEAHDTVADTLRSGMGVRPPPLPATPGAAPIAEGTVVARGIATLAEARRIYDKSRALALGREVGIWRNRHTGAYAVTVGGEGGVSSPLGGLWEWAGVQHFHPNRGNVLTYRNPAPKDVDNALVTAALDQRQHTEFIEHSLPNGGRTYTAYTAHPDGRITIEFELPDGTRHQQNFASLADYQADWGKRTRYVSADPRNPDYLDLIRETDEFYSGRDSDGATMSGTVRGKPRSDAIPTEVFEATEGIHVIEDLPTGRSVELIIDETCPPANDATGQRLLRHVERAIELYQEEGLTINQIAEVRTLERTNRMVDARVAQAKHRGSRINEIFRDLVTKDGKLNNVYVTANRERGIDVFDAKNHVQYDLTTRQQWDQHLRDYDMNRVKDFKGNYPMYRLPTEIRWSK